MNTSNYDLKGELQAQAQLQPTRDGGVKLTKDMSIPDMVRAMAPELKKALPSVLTPERFTRIALSALNNTPQLKQCTPMSFISALLTAAQLGLEPNTPLGQAYLIPYKNKGTLECQFQIGYKELSIRRSLTSILGQGQVFSSPKTRRSRRCIKIEPDAVELLRDYHRYQTEERFKVGSRWPREIEIMGKMVENDLLFTTWEGHPIDPGSISSWFPGFLREHGLPPVRFHSLRHTNASLLIAVHVPAVTVAGRLGHAQASTTANIYADMIQTSDAAAADALDAVFSRIKSETQQSG